MLLLQADVTANDGSDQQLLSEYRVLGLPTVMFFSPNGEEVTDWRITGFKDAEAFISHVKRMKSAQ